MIKAAGSMRALNVTYPFGRREFLTTEIIRIVGVFMLMTKKYHQVLIVDDCSLTLRRMAKELRDAGYLVMTATSGVEALQIIQQSCPDYVITDWQMPNMNGQMLCQCIRSPGGAERYVYVILMTAHSDLMDLVDGLGSGADDYITKPVNSRELLARMAAGARILDLDRRLNYAADHDPLTGVLNRRNLISTTSKLIDLCARKELPITTIMLDIDHFKDINDQYGHLVGDYVLVQVARVLTKRFRNDDYICRYGGEEFVVILPECDEAGAAQCADRCRQEISELICADGSDTFRITASIGVAQIQTGSTATQMVENADRALLYAKRCGRNRVVKYSECPTQSPFTPIPSESDQLGDTSSTSIENV